jgi:hypothetical protein
MVRGIAKKADALCLDVFRVQSHALGLFFDEGVNTWTRTCRSSAEVPPGLALEFHTVVRQRSSPRHDRAARQTSRHPVHIMPSTNTAEPAEIKSWPHSTSLSNAR